MALFGGRGGQQGGGTVGPTVYIRGLDDLYRDLQRMDREFGTTGKTQLQKELQRAATMVAEYARDVTIPQANMVGTGNRRRDRDGREYGKRRKRYKPGGTQRGMRGYVKGPTGIVTNRANKWNIVPFTKYSITDFIFGFIAI